jgi:hypothetical protein
MSRFLIIILVFFIVGCADLPPVSLGYCYTAENGVTHCGAIGIDAGQTQIEKRPVVNDGKKPMYPMTGDELDKILEWIKAKKEILPVIGATSAETKEEPEKPEKTKLQQILEFIE